MDLRNFLQLIPNSVSGDGKTFVATLKKMLDSLLKEIDKMSVNTEQVSNVSLSEVNRLVDNVRFNDIKVSWSIAGIEDYAKAAIWYRTDGEWQKDGESEGDAHEYVIQGAETGEIYSVKVVAINSKGTASSIDDAPMATLEVTGDPYTPNAPTQFVLTWDSQGPLWQWLITDNDDSRIDYFELRLDTDAGQWNANCLGRTRELFSRANPAIRAGTAYLYVKNVFGTYSAPAIHAFNKEKPAKPVAPIVTGVLDGVKITMAELPQACTGYKLHIKVTKGDGVEEGYFDTINKEYTYSSLEGGIEVSYAFTDSIGTGEWSDTVLEDIKALRVDTENIMDSAVGTNQIKDGSVTANKLNNGNIELLGDRALIGGAVKLDKEGITASLADGGAININAAGLSYTDANQHQYLYPKRIMIGTANDGDKVKFTNPWSSAPIVICMPISIDIVGDVKVMCGASDITSSGFTAICHTVSDTGVTVSTGIAKFICIDTSDTDYTIE